MNKDTVSPIGLKGNEALDHIREMMSKIEPEQVKINNSVIELVKTGADNKAYAIVRENHNYFIKVANAKENLTVEDFKYAGGLKNPNEEKYPSYAKATKRLNAKLISIAEAYGDERPINVLMNEAKDVMGKECECAESKIVEFSNKEIQGHCPKCGKETSVQHPMCPECEKQEKEEEKLEFSEGENYEAMPKGMSEVFKSIDDIKKKNLTSETTYKLKLPQQAPAPVPAQPAGQAPTVDNTQQTPPQGNEPAPAENDTPFEKEPFNAGVQADEQSDPKKFIQQLTGKLGQSLRNYNDQQGKPDLELEKFVINSTVSATHTGTMGGSDQKAIIDKIKSAGRDDDNNSNDNPAPETDNAEPPTDNNNGGASDSNTDKSNEPNKNTSESIKKKLHMSEINRTFAPNNKDMDTKDNLEKVINEVFSVMGAEPQKETEPDKETSTPVQTPDKETEKGNPEPTRRSRPWKINPTTQPNPDPKAKK